MKKQKTIKKQAVVKNKNPTSSNVLNQSVQNVKAALMRLK